MGDTISHPFCIRPKGVPEAFTVIRHFMTFTSISLTILCVFIVKRSSSVSKVYANMLVLLLLSAVFIDVFLQWVFDPVFLLPLVCLYRRSPLLNAPISAGVCMALLFSLGTSCGVIYFAIFIYRHQLIVPPGSRYKFSSAAKNTFLTINLLMCMLMRKIPISDLYRSHFADEFLDRAVLDRVDCFFQKNNYLFWGLFFFGHIFDAFFIIAIARHSFILLTKVTHISRKTQELYRILTRALVVQALVPVATVILPLAVTMSITIFFVNLYPNPGILTEWAIDPLDIAFLLISFHATVHSAAMLFTTPAFRTQLYDIFERRTESAPNTTNKISNVSTSGNNMTR